MCSSIWRMSALWMMNAMMRGDFTNLSERKLMDCLPRLGYDIEIQVRPAKSEIGHLRFAGA